MLKKILGPVFILYALIVFLTGLVIVFSVCAIISLRNSLGARKAVFAIIEGWSRVTLFLTFAPLKVTGKPAGGRYIVISNHISYLDAINLFSARPDYFRALGKIEIAKTPLFGFLYRRSVILVDRSSMESRANSMRQMHHFLKEEGNIFIFPEGTFNETGNPLKEFYDGAFRLAISAQTPILPIVFPDALERWHHKLWWTMWPGRNRAIYLEPVQTAGLVTEDIPKLKQQVYTLMESALIKYQAM